MRIIYFSKYKFTFRHQIIERIIMFIYGLLKIIDGLIELFSFGNKQFNFAGKYILSDKLFKFEEKWKWRI